MTTETQLKKLEKEMGTEDEMNWTDVLNDTAEWRLYIEREHERFCKISQSGRDYLVSRAREDNRAWVDALYYEAWNKEIPREEVVVSDRVVHQAPIDGASIN